MHDLVCQGVGAPTVANISERCDDLGVLEPATDSARVEEGQRGGSLGICRGVESGHATSLVRGEDHRTRGSGCVQHGVEILHPRLERGELAAVVRQARATLVEEDQPETLRQLQVEVAPARILPRVDEIRHEVRHVHQVGVSSAHDLIGDCDTAASCVPDLRGRHAAIVSDRSPEDNLPQAATMRRCHGTAPAPAEDTVPSGAMGTSTWALRTSAPAMYPTTPITAITASVPSVNVSKRSLLMPQ